MITYPVTLEADDNGTVLASIPDVPGVYTFGEDEEDALARVAEALETMLQAMMDDREDIPEPSAGGRPNVTLPALSSTKVELYKTMRAQGVRKAELARRLNWHMPQIDRLLDLRHASRLDQIETALRALGRRLVVEIRDDAA